MNWQQWILPAVTFLLGAVFAFLLADAKRKQLRDALSALVEAVVLDDSDQFHRAERTAEALRGARKALGHDPQTTE